MTVSERASKKRVIVAVCTYRRNEPLRLLLNACLRNAEGVRDEAAIGLVIVDDSPDQEARGVAEEFANSFELGLVYLSSRSGNISIARNMAIEAAAGRGDWIAMTDDDCEPDDRWLASLLDTQSRTGCDVATGLMLRRPGATAPAWLLRQNFLSLGEFSAHEGQELATAFTNNCLISSDAIKRLAHWRFDPSLGEIGGEDMVFFAKAKSGGLHLCFSSNAIVHENEPAERLTLAYQLRRYYWHGNSSYVTQTRKGVSRGRMFVHGGMSLLRGLAYSPTRLLNGKTPHFRFGLALVAEGAGKISGSLGARVRHH
jgi:succinoglycan biosynthesis protein ExoM